MRAYTETTPIFWRCCTIVEIGFWTHPRAMSLSRAAIRPLIQVTPAAVSTDPVGCLRFQN